MRTMMKIKDVLMITILLVILCAVFTFGFSLQRGQDLIVARQQILINDQEYTLSALYQLENGLKDLDDKLGNLEQKDYTGDLVALEIEYQKLIKSVNQLAEYVMRGE